jgi:hypothetical protein
MTQPSRDRKQARRGRRAGADGLTIISWRDIPSQVSLTAEGSTAKELLAPRFQHAIDRAAAVADLTDADLYVAEWRRDSQPLPDGATAQTAADLAADIARSLENDYPRERLEQLVASGGLGLNESDSP